MPAVYDDLRPARPAARDLLALGSMRGRIPSTAQTARLKRIALGLIAKSERGVWGCATELVSFSNDLRCRWEPGWPSSAAFGSDVAAAFAPTSLIRLPSLPFKAGDDGGLSLATVEAGGHIRAVAGSRGMAAG